MRRIHPFTAVAAAAAALSIASAGAAANPLGLHAANSPRAQVLAEQEKTMQQLSTPMPSSSPRVDRTQPAADPLPKAYSRADRSARFAQLESAMQRESTG